MEYKELFGYEIFLNLNWTFVDLIKYICLNFKYFGIYKMCKRGIVIFKIKNLFF